MSAPEFRALFNNRFFRQFYIQEISGKNVTDKTSFLGIGRQDSKTFVANTIGDFILSKEQLTSIFGASSARKLLDAVTNDPQFFDIAQYRNIAGQEQLVFSDIKFSKVNSTISEFLDLIGKSVGNNNVKLQIEKFFELNPQDIGHIFGFTNTLLIRTKASAREYILKQAYADIDRQKNIGSVPGIKEAEKYLSDTLKQLDALDDFIDSMVDVLEEYDIATSPIKGLDLDVNIKYRKTAERWAFTWEGRAEQQAAGRQLTTILGTIKQTKAGGKGVRGLFATFGLQPKAALAKNVLSSFINEFVDKGVSSPTSSKLNFLQQKSSPTLLDLIDAGIREALGEKNSYKKLYSGEIKLNPIPLARVKSSGNKSSKTELNSKKQKLQNLRKNIEKQKASLKTIKLPAVPITNLTSLQRLLDAQLVQTVKQNMGTGNRRDILNLRTGRFAESVKVERLSESREGMITAFYSYMRNPYATFSSGGRQETPKTRDPKLLISKSIREVAAQLVTNRLRSVNV